MPTVAISIDLLSKMHAAIGAAKAYRSTEKEAGVDEDYDLQSYLCAEREQLDLALSEYDRADTEAHHCE